VFTIDRKFVDGQTDVQLTVQGPDNDASVLAIAADQPLPDGKLSLGSINLSASTGASIPFSAAGGKDSVALTANASGFFAAGVYPDPADLLKDLSPERDIAAGLALTAQAGSRYFMLHCGYDVGATAKGAVALSVGASASFGGSVSRKADYAVIHQFPNTDGAHDVLESTIQSWILPSQFEGPDAAGEFQIQPRTWIVTEVDGSVALNLGVQAGYDYSWMRQFPGGVLKGDLGLKVQLAANAALGFSANGTFALALSRESAAPVFRLRLFKLDKNGWNFAFDASAGEQVTLPDVFQQSKNIDDLISAVFGVHTAQLVQDLTDPTLTSVSSVAKFVEQRGMSEFSNFTGVNPDQFFAAGKAKVDQFVADWNALTHKPATMLAKILKDNKDVDELTTFLKQIQGLDQAGVTAAIAQAMGDADFFQTAVGQFVNSAVLTTPLAAILSGTEWQDIQTLAGKALDIVNGNTLQSLIDYATKNLGLDVIQKVQSDVDAFNLDAWLQSKLAGFLGKDPSTKLALADVQKVQTALKALLDNAEKFYDLARHAVQKKYEIDFTSTYQESTTSTALVDVAFDLSQPGALAMLQQAIDGDMQQILLQKIPGVTISAATLTHDFNRQSHSSLTMPFINLSTDDVSDSIASVSPVEDNGRVLVYKVDAQDEVKDHTGFFHASSASDSKLALVATIPAQAGITQFSPPSVSYGYTLTKAASAMGTAQLQQDLTPLVGEYMPGLFDRKPLSDWVSAVDGQVDPAHTGVLGPVVFAFDVSLPPTAFQSWFSAPADAKDPHYFALSKALQRRLRQIIPFYYFQDPANYDAGVAANSVLAYQALPPSNGFQLTGDNEVGAANGEIYFDLDGTPTIQALMNTPDFGAALQAAMQAALAIAQGTSEGSAGFYVFNQVNVDNIVRDALTKASQADLLPAVLGSLLGFELDLIDCVVNAAVALAKFRATAGADPSAAINALSAFGDAFVQAFNNHLGGNIVAGSYLRSLGSALFVEAGRALAQNGAVVKPAGLFRMTVLDVTPPVSVDNMLAGNFGQTGIVLRQTLVSL
jgi:hypothetical protein